MNELKTITSTTIKLFSPSCLRHLFQSRSIGMWLVMALRQQGIALINTDSKDIIVQYKGNMFILDPITVDPIFSIWNDYQFSDIGHNDIILDIGAQVGAFTIPASRLAKKVFAVEPLFANELRRNLQLNNVHNAEVIEAGIANTNGKIEIGYWGKTAQCCVLPFNQLKDLIGHVDFLKLDCEGCEWLINPAEFQGIRSLEVELHASKHSRQYEWEQWLTNTGYSFDTTHNSNRTLLHARLKP